MDASGLAWIDAFARSIAPHVAVRREDSLLILIPNQAYRLNPTGVEILDRALAGEPILSILGPKASEPAAAESVHEFFCDLRALLTGCLGEGRGRRSVQVVPYRAPMSSLPVLSEFAPTYRCNLACRFCYAGSPEGTGGEAEVGTADAKRILETVRRDAQVPGISFTGGEPTLRADLAELTAHAVSIGLRVNLITNGTLLDDERVRELKAAGLRSAQVSLEGPEAGVHDRLTGREGSFEKTVAAVRRLRDAGIPVHTNTTVNRENLPHLPRMADLAASLGLERLSMNLVIPCGTARTRGSDLWVRYSEVGPSVLAVKRRARDLGIRFFWYSPTPYCVFNPIAEGLGNKGCAACDGLLSVAPDGSVLPCSSVRRPVGNLLRRPFREVWDSALAQGWRNKDSAPPGCRPCSLFEVCTGACPIYWDAVGTGEIEGRCGEARD
jgi:radical SAM protein with 4Fe4S-binding SPASM domain